MSLPIVPGAMGLGFDLNRGLDTKLANQQTADVAALGAAMQYQDTAQVSKLTPTAQDIATANAWSGKSITAELLTDYPSAGEESVKVTIISDVPYTFARVLGLPASYEDASEAIASVTGGDSYTAPCFFALSGASDAFTLSGGATISASDCSVAANGSINNNGTSISAKDIIAGAGSITNNSGSLTADSLRYAGSFTNPAWNNAVPPAGDRKNATTTLTDPWAGSTDLATARSLLGTYTANPALTDPVTPTGTDWTLSYSPSSNVAAYRTTPYGGTYVIPAGNYSIKKLTVAGGITVTFASGSNITVSNGVSIGGGSSVNFGNSNLYVNGGFDSGSNGVTIGNGILWIGSGTVSLQGVNTKGNGDVTINSTVTLGGGQRLTMGIGTHRFGRMYLSGGGTALMGAGDFSSNGGVYVGSNSELALGTGNIILGKHTDGSAATLDGSAKFFMGDGTFSANGNITTQGGSRIVFGKTTNHLINGNMNIAGSVLFGAGRYTINGSFTNGTGGTTWPYTSTLSGVTYGQTLEGVSVSGYDMAGVNVSFILGGTINLGGGAKTKLIAPSTTVSGGQIADLLLTSQTSAATGWGEGALNNFVGSVYLPNSNVTMSGGNNTLSGGQCFMLIANKISATGGANAGTNCPSLNTSPSTTGKPKIRLVQ